MTTAESTHSPATRMTDTPSQTSSPHQSRDGSPSRNAAVLITGAGGEVGHGLIAALSGQSESGRQSAIGNRQSEGGRQSEGEGRGTSDCPLPIADCRLPIVALDVRELDPAIRAHCTDAFTGDICDDSLLKRLLSQYEITEIYHLAALLSTRAEFVPEAAHEVNVNGTLNLLRLAAEQARSHGRRVKFLFPSTIAVYGLPDLKTKHAAGAIGEDEYAKPTTMYGCNKLYCEHLGRYFAKHYRQLAKDRTSDLIDFRAIRFPGIISAETLPSGGTSDFAPEMIHAAAQGKPYACFVREDARIPFMTMPDAIEAILKLASAEESQLSRCVYNVKSFNPSAGEIAALVQKYFPNGETVMFEPDEARQAIVDTWPADVDDSAARRDWGYSPRHDVQKAFDEYLVPSITARYQ